MHCARSDCAASVFQESFGPDPKFARENFAKLKAKAAHLRERETALVNAVFHRTRLTRFAAPQLELIARSLRLQKSCR